MAGSIVTEGDGVVVGVDTHADIHVAVVLSSLGARLGSRLVATTAAGFGELVDWARGFGPVRCFGVEGTGSYGAALARHLGAGGHAVVEVDRPDRRTRLEGALIQIRPLTRCLPGRGLDGGSGVILRTGVTSRPFSGFHFKGLQDPSLSALHSTSEASSPGCDPEGPRLLRRDQRSPDSETGPNALLRG